MDGLHLVPGRRVFGRAPKLPIGAVGNTHFENFIYRNCAPVMQHDVLVELRDIQKAALQSEFQGKFNLSVSSSFRELQSEQLFPARTVCYYQGVRKEKSKTNGEGRESPYGVWKYVLSDIYLGWNARIRHK